MDTGRLYAQETSPNVLCGAWLLPQTGRRMEALMLCLMQQGWIVLRRVLLPTFFMCIQSMNELISIRSRSYESVHARSGYTATMRRYEVSCAIFNPFYEMELFSIKGTYWIASKYMADGATLNALKQLLWSVSSLLTQYLSTSSRIPAIRRCLRSGGNHSVAHR